MQRKVRAKQGEAGQKGQKGEPLRPGSNIQLVPVLVLVFVFVLVLVLHENENQMRPLLIIHQAPAKDRFTVSSVPCPSLYNNKTRTHVEMATQLTLTFTLSPTPRAFAETEPSRLSIQPASHPIHSSSQLIPRSVESHSCYSRFPVSQL